MSLGLTKAADSATTVTLEGNIIYELDAEQNKNACFVFAFFHLKTTNTSDVIRRGVWVG